MELRGKRLEPIDMLIHRVASEIGMTTRRVRKDMSSRELLDWSEYFRRQAGEQTEDEIAAAIQGAFKWQTSETYSSTSAETPRA